MILEAFESEIEEYLGLETFIQKDVLHIMNPHIDETYFLSIEGSDVRLKIVARNLTDTFKYDLTNPNVIELIIKMLTDFCDPYCEFKKRLSSDTLLQ